MKSFLKQNRLLILNKVYLLWLLLVIVSLIYLFSLSHVSKHTSCSSKTMYIPYANYDSFKNEIFMKEKDITQGHAVSYNHVELQRLKKETMFLFQYILQVKNLNIKNQLLERYRSLNSQIDILVNNNQMILKNESNALINYVKQQIIKNQEPVSSCQERRKLIIREVPDCQIDSVIHHITSCFFLALGTNRTLLLDHDVLPDSIQDLFSFFKPISNKCSKYSLKGLHDLEREEVDDYNHGREVTTNRDVLCALPNSTHSSALFSPQTYPSVIDPYIHRFHANPPAWWAGHVINQLLQPQQKLEKLLDKIQLKHPIVGLHFDLNEKNEAPKVWRKIEKYMTYVEDWFQTQERRISRRFLANLKITRRIYVAADGDENFLQLLSDKYANYEIFHNIKKNKAGDKSSRILTDVFTLIKCDHVIMTDSSDMNNLIYFLLQTHHVDATYRTTIFNYQGSTNYSQLHVAVSSHRTNPPPSQQSYSSELSFNAGDVIEPDIKVDWDPGWCTGRNLKTGLYGSYPAFKVIFKYETVSYPFDTTIFN